jgi:transaldolase
MMDGYFKRVQNQTRSRFWINNVTIREAHLAIEEGAVGCTQNPSYTWKMLTAEDGKQHAEILLRKILLETDDDSEVLVRLQKALVADIAQIFLPLYNESHGKNGYVSIQGDPFREDYESIMRFARYNRQAGPNIMIKIPVTQDGLKAVGQCIREGMPVNATEVMSVQQAMDLCDVYDDAIQGMENPPKVYLSHIAGIFDEYLTKYVSTNGIEISTDHLFQAGKIVAKKIRSMMDERATGVGFINGGARGLHHFTEWVGADIATTINWKGTAEDLVLQNPPVVSRFDNPVAESVLDSLIATLVDFRSAYFVGGLHQEHYAEFGPVELFCSSFQKAWKQALATVAEFRRI